MVASVEVDFVPEPIGLPLVAEEGLLGTITFNGGASDEEMGSSTGFLGLDLTVGEVPRDIPGFLTIVGLVLFTEEQRLDAVELPEVQDGVEGLCAGVEELDIDFEVEGVEDLAGGVEERAAILEGVEDLTRGAMGLLEGTVPLLVGVDDLEGFDFTCRADPLAGVGNLAAIDFWPTSEDGLLFPVAQESTLADVDGCLDVSFKGEDSSGRFCGSAFGSVRLAVVPSTPVSNEGNGEVPDGETSQS